MITKKNGISIIIAIFLIFTVLMTAGCISNGELQKDTNLQVTETATAYHIEHTWEYNHNIWTYTADVPKETYNFFKNRYHSYTNYANYAVSDMDRDFIDGLVDVFRQSSAGQSDVDVVYNIIAFVQALPYLEDLDSSGTLVEYPKYPIETIVDGGGDCEDTAILVAAILNRMGYDAVLISLPGHMAVGIAGDDSLTGGYYTYNGKKYYYLETTNRGFDAGYVRDDYLDVDAKILPLVQQPEMTITDVDKNIPCVQSNEVSAIYRVTFDLENTGAGTTKGLKMYVTAMAPSEGNDMVWYEDTFVLPDYQEGKKTRESVELAIPRKVNTEIRIVLTGDNIKGISRTITQFYVS